MLFNNFYKWLRAVFSSCAKRQKVDNAGTAADELAAVSNTRGDDAASRRLEFPSWPPPNPREILAERDAYRKRLGHRRYRAPPGVFEDEPLFALYRLYEWLMAGHTVNMRNELEFFWWRPWPVCDIPDPGGAEDDPERYAVLSCIPALLVEAFNERIDLGLRREEPHSILSLEEQLEWAATPKKYEKEPPWAASPPLRETLHIPARLESYQTLERLRGPLESLEDPRADPAFKMKNILILRPHIHFI